MHKLFIIITNLLLILFTCAVQANNVFTLNTSSFLNKGLMPSIYSCNGKNISPGLNWANAPANTKSFALILSDKDAPSGIFYHWILYNMPTTTTSLAEGEQTIPTGAELGTNSFNRQQYDGPCPPKGAQHTYIFALYALDDNLKVHAHADAKTVLKAIQKHTLATTELTAVYAN